MWCVMQETKKGPRYYTGKGHPISLDAWTMSISRAQKLTWEQVVNMRELILATKDEIALTARQAALDAAVEACAAEREDGKDRESAMWNRCIELCQKRIRSCASS